MFRSISEPDWKVFRRLHAVAVERYCDLVLTEAQRLLADSAESSCDRYRALYDLMRRRDKEMERAFDDLRRSTALLQIAIIHGMGLWPQEEIAQFSPETRAMVSAISRMEI